MWGVITISAMKKIIGLWKPIIFICGIILLFILNIFYDIGGNLSGMLDWIDTFGFFGPMIFIFLYIGATIAAVPGTILGVSAGVIFGSFLGVILVSIGSTVGAAICFLIGRYIARESIEKWLVNNERFQRLDQLTEDHGVYIIAITRLIPIFPFNIINYGFGLTRVSFKTYVFWSWLCMLPGTILFVVGGDVLTRFITTGELSFDLIAILVSFGLVMTIISRYVYKNMIKNEKKKTD